MLSKKKKGSILGNKMELRLQFKLVIGPLGKWVVEEANVLDHEPVSPTIPLTQVTHLNN